MTATLGMYALYGLLLYSSSILSYVYVRNSDGQKQVIVSTPLNMAGCYISQSISNNELQTQKLLFFGILCGILIGILAIGILLMFIWFNSMKNSIFDQRL